MGFQAKTVLSILSLGLLSTGCTQTYVYQGIQPVNTYTYVQPVQTVTYVQPAPIVYTAPSVVYTYPNVYYAPRYYGPRYCQRGYYGRVVC